jgi:hypothetical protein
LLRHAEAVHGDPVDDHEPIGDDELQAAAEGGDELARWALRVGMKRRWGRHGWSGGGPAHWRVGRVGPIRRRLIVTGTRAGSWLWTVLARPVEVAGQVRTPNGSVRWDLAAAEGWLAVRLPGQPARFSALGHTTVRGTTQVSGCDRHNRLFCVLALSQESSGGEGDDQSVVSDGVVVDTEVRLKKTRLRILGIIATGRPIDELYDEHPPQVAGWQRVHALDSGHLWIGVFSADAAG